MAVRKASRSDPRDLGAGSAMDHVLESAYHGADSLVSIINLEFCHIWWDV